MWSREAVNSLWVGIVSARIWMPGLAARSMRFGCEVSAVNLLSYAAQSNIGVSHEETQLSWKGERLQIVRTTLES